jgi:hypothetical protein
MMLLIVIGTYYFMYVSAETKYQGDPAHNIMSVNTSLDHMARDDVIYILSSQLIFLN